LAGLYCSQAFSSKTHKHGDLEVSTAFSQNDLAVSPEFHQDMCEGTPGNRYLEPWQLRSQSPGREDVKAHIEAKQV